MKKQINGQINLFDYFSDKIESYSKEDRNTEINFFSKCKDCWCKNCRHNEKLDGEPRDFAGVQNPCPSCDFCIKAGKAEICEIDSYENGCKLRALEEGIEP